MSYLLEDEEMLDESSEEEGSDEDDDDDKSYTVGHPENAELLHRFRKYIDEWAENKNQDPKLLIGEVDEDDDQIISYYGNETHVGITPLNLNLITKLNDTSNAEDVKNLIEDWMEDIPEGAKTNWMLSNQDYSRAASRLDPDLLDGLYMLTLLLPGQAITYYGEEIGMRNTNVSWDDTIDIKALEQTEETFEDYTRDPVRTPMQWDETTSAGFSTNETTFLPVNLDYLEINVEEQSNDTDSNLEAFKKLAALRENSIFTEGDYELAAVNDDQVLILKRSLDNDTCIVIINFGLSKETVNLTDLYPDLEEDLQVMVDSSNSDVEEGNDEDDDDDIENDSFTLDAKASAVLCDKDDFVDFPFETTTISDSTTESGEDSDEDDDSEEIPLSTTEEPEQVEQETTTESSTDNSASSMRTLELVTIVHLALLLLLRTL